MTSPAELRELHDEELENRLTEASQELFNLRFQHVTGQLDNYARLGEVRREVARVKTLLRQREIEAAEAQEAAEEADPDLERLLAEEEDITRRLREQHETPHFRGGDEG